MNKISQNKKHLLAFVFIMLMSAYGMRANPVDMNTAREVGLKFMNANSKVPIRSVDDMQLVTTYSISQGEAAYYIFNTPNGFVIVAADDCVTPILGYSNERQFVMENIPIQLQSYLEGFVEQIQYGIENHIEADEQTTQQWEMVRITGQLTNNRSNLTVEPLISTIWGQSCFYNDLCPEDDQGDCGHVLTGCVATAMAQIMRYWSYPTNGGGTFSYIPYYYPQQTANFGATTYDWANMPDDLFDYQDSPTHIKAVAKLMWHCGVAVNMDYSAHGSGTFDSYVAPALIDYFGYSSDLSMIYKEDYSDAGWINMIKNDLDFGRPVFYRGGDEGGLGGHAFVCDGYDINNLLHFNWGWEGSCNGYFFIGALNPSIYAYNVDNMAIINIHPGCTSETTYQISALSNSPEEGSVSGSGCFSCGTSCTLIATPNEGYVFNHWKKNGEVVSYLPSYSLCVTETADYVAYFQQIDGIAIGVANSSSPALPTYSYYSMSQQIYTADELGNKASEMMSVSFFNTKSTMTRNFTIYLVNTDKTTFENTTDWITITEEDEMFSGSVTMVANDWTTIYFNRPFNYDGISNLALIVDDNSNSWNNGKIYCRTYDTNENQAISVYGSGTDFDPYNPTGYIGSVMSEKNQIVFGITRYYPVTVSSNPLEGGTASGDIGPYYYGQPVTLSATANEHYVFNTWTKNEEIVSCFSTDDVPVTEATEFVANFQQFDGIAIGDAVSTNTCLPTNSYYSLTQQIYTAEEMGTGACEISSVSFFNTGIAKSRNLTIYLVNTEKTSFESSTDWIAVTEADRLYSGNVNMAAKSWTTIYFNTPFNYDGLSNVALVVDDNSYSYNNGTSCRTIATNEIQTIYISGSGMNYDPCNPTSYTGTLLAEKNQIIFGFPNYNYVVAATANPVEGGTITGGESLYYQGQNCTLTATANEGFCFFNWTENGTVVSSNATYSFTVTGNRNLVANFGLPLNIVATANPEEGGIVSGGGDYDFAQTCTLTATHNDGYVFSKWSKNDTVVSYLSTYSFSVAAEAEYVADFQQVDGIVIGDATYGNPNLPTSSSHSYSLTEQIYTADELGSEACQISSVSFFNTRYSNNRNITLYMISTDKIAFESSTDWIPVTEAEEVFCGNVTMTANTWTTIHFSSPFSYDGLSNIALIVDDNTGWGYSEIRCRAFDTNENQSISLSGFGINYNPLNPSNYVGSLSMAKNQVIFGFPSYDYALSVSANPEEGGTVSGGGMYYWGQSVPITAIANEGYVFENWIKNGNSYPVSLLSTYNVSIEENSEYIANFQLVDGIVIGDATNSNSFLPTSSCFSLSQQIYTAEEINSEACDISSVSFFYLQGFYAPRRFKVFMVSTDKTSYESNMDWIPVTEADMVFNGSVTSDPNGWVTISFETPFSYDGFSNLALIIVDNTGWDISRISRTFSTEESQAIMVSASDMNYDPYNTNNYEGALLWEKNQIIFGVPSYENEYTVSVLADPEEGGIVDGGGGLYYYGQPVCISATNNEGYVFNYWTKDYELVSYLSTDLVPVTENSEYVANFQQMNGTVVGEATYNSALLPTSSFSPYNISQQIYTVDELGIEAGEISSIALFSMGFSYFCDLSIYMVNTDKTSFENNTDWITVTEADQVFDGMFYFFGGSWSTIYFSTPFVYDGTSNIAIVVNNKGGEYYDWQWGLERFLSFRTFDAEGTQAILCSDYENSFDLYNLSNYSGILMSEKNEIVFGTASYEYIVNVSANPSEGGTVSGGGDLYYYGQPIPISATANEGYVFNYWTQNGWPVSYYSSYIVSVTGNAEYVANFQQMEGISIGEAISDNGNLPVSDFPYALSQQIYTAGELNVDACEIYSVSFFNLGYSDTRELAIYMVPTNKMYFESNSDWITVTESDQVFDGTVFIDENGWSTIYFNTPFMYNGFSNLALVVYDKTNDWGCGVRCRTFDTGSLQAMYYEDYDVIDPYDLIHSDGWSTWGCFGTLMTEKNQVVFGTSSNTIEQTVTLSQGWNWFSTYVGADDLLDQLEAGLGTNGVSINTQGAVLVYRNGRWIGGLHSIENNKGYKIKTSAPIEVTIEGQIVDPSSCPITITQGSNWIGYPLTESKTVGTALAGFTPSNGDVIMTQGGTTVYRNGHWLPATFTFKPGKGYIYKSTSLETKTLIFSNGGK